MEKESNKFKLKLSRIFTSSCKTQDISEVIDHNHPVFTPQNTIFLQSPLMEAVQEDDYDYDDEDDSFSSPVIKSIKQTPLSSTSSSSLLSSSSSSSSMMYCKPRCPETFDQMVRENCIISGNPVPRRKIAGKYSVLSPNAEFSGGRRCPPASPATPLFSQKQGIERRKKKKKNKNGGFYKNENTQLKKIENPNQCCFYSSNETDIGDWFSSDDEKTEDETETLFSLKSVSFSSKSISPSSDSDPSGQARVRVQSRNRRRKAGSRRKKKSGLAKAAVAAEEEEIGVVPVEGKVKDTFAVVKSSRDPYNDFRTSMVEMIIEKQIFGANELEQLLKCFLSLNSTHHHRVIVEVFTEIWDALFSHCS